MSKEILLEVGKTYKTKSGGEVTMKNKVRYQAYDFDIFQGDNNLEYNYQGIATYVLMRRGRFRSEKNDIDLNQNKNEEK